MTMAPLPPKHSLDPARTANEEKFVDKVAIMTLKEMIRPNTGLTEEQIMNCPKAAYGIALAMLSQKRLVNPECIK